MSLIPWKNKQKETGRELSTLAGLRQEMDRLFDSFVRDPWGALDWPFGGERGWAPAVDIAETDREVIVRAELPGIDPKDLEISVIGNQLVLAGEKKESTEKKEKNLYHSESRYGSFRRVIPLPEAADTAKVDAGYANGVLTIRLPKSPSAVPKKIDVKVNP